MTQVTNTSSMARRWDNLANADTNRTLALEPGESAEVELPEGFSNPHLTVGTVTPAPASAPAPAPVFSAPTFAPSTAPAIESDDTEKE